MNEENQTLIHEIAIKHGVLLGKDDPILILQTMNAKLMEENARAQHHLLDIYKSNLEAIVKRWDDETKDKSERILNASLLAARESMQIVLKENTESLMIMLRKEFEEAVKALDHNLSHYKKAGAYNIIASLLTTVSVVSLIFIMYFH